MLIGEILSSSANRTPKRVALIGNGQELQYKDFEDAANRVANALRALKLDKGSTVAILSTNSPQYAITYFAIARAGLVSAHVSFRSTAREIAYVLNKVAARVVFFESEFADVVQQASLDVSTLRYFVAMDSDRSALLPWAITFDSFVENHDPTAPNTIVSKDDPVAITFTGGTTGLPKAVLVSHKARCATSIAAVADFGLVDSDIVIVSTPLFHTAGLFVWFTTAVMLGATVVTQKSWAAGDFINLVESHGVTAAFLVPSQLSDLVAAPEFSQSRMPSLKKIGYAGAPMGKALFERVRKAFPKVEFTENYGQSEVCPITVRRPTHVGDKFDSVGRAAKGVQLRVADSNKNFLGPGIVGEVVVRSQQAFTEYLGDPEQTAQVFQNDDDWLWTGDVGYLDEDGFLRLVDRAKDMLVSGAENIYPAEIENVLYQHQSVAECAVFGIPDERFGEVPAAHIVLKNGHTVTEQEIIDFCSQHIARFKRPRLVRFVNSLPKTAVGKIKKVEIRASYWQGRDKRI